MLLSDNNLAKFSGLIRRLPDRKPFRKSDLLIPEFRLFQDRTLEIYYSPHNESVNRDAAIMIVGITPGWTQMEKAYRQVRSDLYSGIPLEEIQRRSKRYARFAGSMRNNLIGMLDALHLNRELGLPSCSGLFDQADRLLHTTSLLRFPVFIDGDNYTGHRPVLLKHPFLRAFALESIKEELKIMRQPLIIPLGQSVESVLRLLVETGELDPMQCLFGFPHPSGANGHRITQFQLGKDSFREHISRYFGRHLLQ